MILQDAAFDRTAVYDLAIAACGYERRSSYVVRQGLRARSQLALEISRSGVHSFAFNVDEFKTRGWDLASLDEALAQVRTLAKGGTVAIDISSLSRELIAHLVLAVADASCVELVDFIYAPADFPASIRAAGDASVTLTAGPLLPSLSGSLRASSLPIGLILGIGVEKYRAAGLIELLEPSRVWQYVAQGGDPRFDALLDEMRGSLGTASRATTIGYPIQSLRGTYARISSLLFSQTREFRMIVAPSGPKIFALACILAALDCESRYRPAVWRVGAPRYGPTYDVEEAGPVTVGRLSQFSLAR